MYPKHPHRIQSSKDHQIAKIEYVIIQFLMQKPQQRSKTTYTTFWCANSSVTRYGLAFSTFNRQTEQRSTFEYPV